MPGQKKPGDIQMKLHTTCAALAAALLSATPFAASAQEDVDIAFNAAVGTDYVFRGVSQSLEDPAISGGVDLTYGSFYAGAWASNVDFGVVSYLYGNAPGGADYDYVEFKAAASRAIGPVTAGVAFYVSPDFFGADDEATYLELNGAYATPAGWTLSGAVGQQWLDVSDDYVTWNLGAAYALTDNLTLDVRYHDTDIDGLAIAEDRFVATIKAAF
jgi:opacity protein-like surface antigen